MRSRMLVLTVGTGLFLAACSDRATDKTSVPVPGPGQSGATATLSPGATGAPGGPVTGGVDRKTVCTAYQKAEADAEAKMTVVLPKAAEAIGDPVKGAQVVAELKAVLSSFEAALKVESARVGDAELKAAIDGDVTVLAKAQQDLSTAGNDVTTAFAAINTDSFTAMGEKVKALCAK